MSAFRDQLAQSLKTDGSSATLDGWASRIISEQVPLRELTPLLHADPKTALHFLWLIGTLCLKKPEVVSPCTVYLFHQRDQISIRGLERSLARIFTCCGIPVAIEGEAVNELFRWLQAAEHNVSTKHHALLALAKFAQREPGIREELKLVIEDQRSRNSAPFDKLAAKILRQL